MLVLLFLCFFRESIYRLLPQTTPENIAKNFDQYTIDPTTRYPNLNCSGLRPHQVRARTFNTSFRLSTSILMVSTCRCATCTSEKGWTPALWSAPPRYADPSTSADVVSSAGSVRLLCVACPTWAICGRKDVGCWLCAFYHSSGLSDW